jgi:hypothetical protein
MEPPVIQGWKSSRCPKLIHESNLYYTWGTAGAASHMTNLDLVSSNIRNRFNLHATYDWGNYLKSDITYERYLYDHLRVLGGVTLRSHEHTPIDEITPTAIAGIRYFTPYMFHLTFLVDNQLRPELRLHRSLMIFPAPSCLANLNTRLISAG